MQSNDFAVDHDIDRGFQLKVDTMNFADLRQGMLNMAAVIQTR